jgi:glycosyltransferase involved in cell wall biosynthesis
MSAIHHLLLMSGLSMKRRSSFSRQLSLLAEAFRRLGIETGVIGPVPEEYTPVTGSGNRKEGLGETLRVSPRAQLEYVGSVCSENATDAVIMLGYPEQFPLLHLAPALHTPIFLWAQCSRPPNPDDFGEATVIPLTPITGKLLRRGGVPSIGPVIPHGVDTGLFSPDEAYSATQGRENSTEKPFIIGTVGAHSARKGFRSILETCAGLQRTDCHFRLVIKTDRALSLDGTDIHQVARLHSVVERLTLITEELDELHLRQLYREMDMYVNMSEWEGFCIPVVEAMACGVPVAAMPLQGPGEIVPYGDLVLPASDTLVENGSILLQADTEAAAEIICRALHNGELLSRLSIEGVRTARSVYDIGVVARRWVDVIGSALGR